jgi:predicted acetyltransferase
MIETVTLERGKRGQRATLDALAQLYIHDFTEFLGPKNLDVGEDGRFGDEMGLEEYWTKPDRSVWFIRADGKLAGFALLSMETKSGKPTDFNMAQFFVTRPYRGGKDVAGRAVQQILNERPGQWEVAIMERNTPALRFWPRAVMRARISGFESETGVGKEPTRTLLRFVVLAPTKELVEAIR